MQKAIITLVSVFLILIVLLFFFGFSKIEKPPVDSLDQTSYVNFGEPQLLYSYSEPFNRNGYESVLITYELDVIDDSGNMNLKTYVVYLVSVPERNTTFEEFIAQPSNYNKSFNISEPYAPFIDRLKLDFQANLSEPFIFLNGVGEVEFNRYSFVENGAYRLAFSEDYYLRMPLTIDNVINPINTIAEYLKETRPKIFEDAFQDINFDEDATIFSVFRVISAIFEIFFELFWQWPNWILKHILLYFDYFGAVFLW